MAKAKGKSKKTNTRSKAKGPSAKAKSPSASSKLSAAMKSLNNNRTPIHTLLPREKGPAFRTAAKKGGRGTFGFTGPHKLLLSLTDPGSAPKAPKVVTNPVGKQMAQFDENQRMLKEGGPKMNPKLAAQLREQNKQLDMEITKGQQSLAYKNYTNYLGDFRDYEGALSDHTTKTAEYKAGQTVNLRRTSDYRHDLNQLKSRRVKSTKHKVTSRGATTHGRGHKGSR